MPLTVTSDEFATALTGLVRHSSRAFFADLESYARQTWGPLAPDERIAAAAQLFIAYLWAVSKVLGRDKRALDILHERYLSGCYRLGETHDQKGLLANAAQTELLERYNTYNKAWDNDMRAKGGTALSFEMAQVLFPKRKPVFDFLLLFEIEVRMIAFMTTVQHFRTEYEIVDT